MCREEFRESDGCCYRRGEIAFVRRNRWMNFPQIYMELCNWLRWYFDVDQHFPFILESPEN
jgi:hypothetical protein